MDVGLFNLMGYRTPGRPTAAMDRELAAVPVPTKKTLTGRSNSSPARRYNCRTASVIATVPLLPLRLPPADKDTRIGRATARPPRGG